MLVKDFRYPKPQSFRAHLPFTSTTKKIVTHTPRKMNMAPENTPMEEENDLPNHHFQVQAVNLRGCTIHVCFFFKSNIHVGKYTSPGPMDGIHL